MMSWYVIDYHKAAKPHYDLRLLQNEVMRCWSILREPPDRAGVRRLAVEREEALPSRMAYANSFKDEAFGEGRIYRWDNGQVEISEASADLLILTFKGEKLAGRYELRRMNWYPGNRWLLKKSG